MKTGPAWWRPGIIPRPVYAAAALALLWESAVSALAPCLAIVGLFIVIALLDGFAGLPAWLHLTVLAAFAVLLGVTARHAKARLQAPSHRAILERIEHASGLNHRPLAALESDLATGAGDPVASALWSAHRERVRRMLGRMRGGAPRDVLASRDPYGLRVPILLLLLIGSVAAGSDAPLRLYDALSPRLGAGAARQAVTVELWVNPPAYTAEPPIYLAGGDGDKPIPVPVGSTVLVQVHGTSWAPHIEIGRADTEMKPLSGADYAGQAAVGNGTDIAIVAEGRTLAHYDLRPIPDRPPTIAFVRPPRVVGEASLGIEYEGRDDYGVKAVRLEIRRPAAGNRVIAIDLATPAPPRRVAKGMAFEDLSGDSWAGLDVEMRLVAADETGQTGVSAPVRLVLPERRFQNPIARAIVEQRRILASTPDRAPAAAETLDGLSQRPEALGNDVLAFLALRVAVHQLQYEGAAAAAGLQDLLWQTALRIEDGLRPAAQESLRSAQDALQRALASGASQDEIERLAARLQQAVGRYLQSLAQQAAKSPGPGTGNGATVTPQDIQRILQRALDMARSGNPDAARMALAQLEELLEALRVNKGASAEDEAAAARLRGMEALQNQQRDLMDESFRRSQRARQDAREARPSPQDRAEAGAQQGIRRQLDAMAKALGTGAPDSMHRAGAAMDAAERALRDGDPDRAMASQSEALDALQQADRDMMAAMRGEESDAGPGDPSRDPLGRSSREGPGGLDRGDVAIPDKADIQRSREILDELRRREGEMSRPQEERDYIERLLQNF